MGCSSKSVCALDGTSSGSRVVRYMKKANRHYDLLLFDLDNTILDFTQCEVDVLLHTFQNFGWNLTDEQVHRYLEINERNWRDFEQGKKTQDETVVDRFDEFCEYLGVEIPAWQVNRDYLSSLGTCAVFEPYAEEVLRTLRMWGYRMSVLTNGLRVVQQDRFDLARLDRYFDRMITIDEAGVAKPNREIFDYALRLYQIPANRAVYIGDHWDIDMVGATNADLDGIHYIRHTPHQAHQEAECVTQISSLIQLLDIL